MIRANELSLEHRRMTLLHLREIWTETQAGDLTAGKKRMRLRAIETAIVELTEPLDDHGVIDENWDLPCLCGECRSCA